MKITAYPLHDHAATLKPAPEGRGWNFLCPAAFEACWNGGSDALDVEIRYGEGAAGAPGPAGFAQSQRGRGRLTFHPGYQCKTGGDAALWVRGPADAPKDGLHPLEATIDTSVLPGTVLIDWQFTRPGQTVRFAEGEPFCTILPYPKGTDGVTVDVVPLGGDVDAWEAALEQLAESQEVQGTLARLGTTTTPEPAAKSRWAAHLAAPRRPPAPAVSCLCPTRGGTRGRVELLEEAIQSFLAQDYPGPKELLVLNDAAGRTLVYDHPEVQIVNLPCRLHSLAEAYKAAAGLASHNLLFVWPDDAISLPHRLSFSVARFGGREALFKADKAWLWNAGGTAGGTAGELSGPEPEAPHGGACWRRDWFVRLHGYPHVQEGEEDYASALEALCEAAEPGAVRVHPVATEEVYYIRRGEAAESPEMAREGIPEGQVRLRPRWRTDYGALVAARLEPRPREGPAAARTEEEIPFPPPFVVIPPPAPLPPGRAETLFRGDYPKKISVILPATNESVMLERTVESFAAALPAESEILVVDNGSTDGCADFLLREERENVHLLRAAGALGVSGARNHGLARAQGEIVVFADAHIDVPERFWEPLVATLGLPHVGVVAPGIGVMGKAEHRAAYGQRIAEASLRVEWLPWQAAEPYPVPTLGGGFMAMRHDTLKQAGAFDEGMPQWGSEDLEICVRYWLLGYEVWVVPEVTVLHYFRNRRPYGVQWHLMTHNLLRVALLHFNAERTARVTSALRNRTRFGPALALAVDSDVWQKRAEFAARRVRDDDWLFDRFKESCHV